MSQQLNSKAVTAIVGACLYSKRSAFSRQPSAIMLIAILKVYLLAVFSIFAAPMVQAFPRPESKKPALDGFLDSGTDSLTQVTSVSELRDVAPNDWAYEALRSLVERYGCIVGYPDRTYRGNRSLSRWEFAAGLNACLNTMERLLQENVTVLQEDINKLKKLAEEFQTELAALGTRIDNLESRVAYLEDHQFSTTTKLEGEVIFGLSGVASGERNGGQNIPQVPIFSDRIRLELNTSFTGKDLLFTRISAGNTPAFSEVTGTFQSELSFTSPTNNQLGIEQLFYRFPATDNINVWVAAAGGAFDDFTNTLNVLDGDGGSGAISAFGTRSPIYYGAEGAGVGVQGNFGDFQLSAGYLAEDAANPSQGNGLFNGAYGMIAQVGYIPGDNFGIALTYANRYNTEDSFRVSNFEEFTEQRLDIGVPTISNAYGLEFSWKLMDGFVLGGWGGYTNTKTLSETVKIENTNTQLSRGSLGIWNWAVTLAFPDAFKKGNLAGIIVGMQPFVANSTVGNAEGFNASAKTSSLHFEAFYQYAVNDNIALTPGIIVITSPDYNPNNSTLVIGTIRTTFTF